MANDMSPTSQTSASTPSCLRDWYASHPWLHWSHAAQWAVAVALGLCVMAITAFWQPFCREFHPTDPEISMPFKPTQTFPNWTIPIIGWAVPMLVGIVVILVKRVRVANRRRDALEKTQRRTDPCALPHDAITVTVTDTEAPDVLCASVAETAVTTATVMNDSVALDLEEELALEHTASAWHEVHTLSLCLWQACIMATVVTTVLKVYAGRHRPDFVGRLVATIDFDPYAWDMRNATQAAEMMDVVCTAATVHPDVLDGLLSFPSGHASFAFAGWTVIALLVSAAWGTRSRFGMSAAVAAMFVLIPPAMIAVSRTRDNRHHWGDIVGGAFIGVAFACLAFRVHYSSVSTDPYNSRTQLDAERKLEQRKQDKVMRDVEALVVQSLSMPMSVSASPRHQDTTRLLTMSPRCGATTQGSADITETAGIMLAKSDEDYVSAEGDMTIASTVD